MNVSFTTLSEGIIRQEVNILISSGDILYVGGTGEGNYTSIQDAVNESSDGDTVFVYDDSSPYYENVVIDKSINLRGENRDTTVIFGLNNGSVVSILADEVEINGFNIQSHENLTYSSGLNVVSNYSSIFNNNISSYKGYGIYLSGNNNFINNNFIDPDIFLGIGIGIHGDSNSISGNIISNQGAGLILINSNDNNIENNKISNNLYGIMINGSSNNIISSNNMSMNIFNGIILYYSTDNNIISNTIEFSNCGVELSFSKRNKIFENNFLRNSRHAYFENCRNKWKNNYWNRPRLLPKAIVGVIRLNMPFPFQDVVIRWRNFDLRPSLKPYEIGA